MADSSPLGTALRGALDGDLQEIRDQVREWHGREDRTPTFDVDRERHRELVHDWLQELADTGAPSLMFPSDFGGEGDPERGVAAFEVLAMGDLSLLVKVGVQFGLFGGAVQHLGTRRHHEAHLQAIAEGRLLGCFAMTEAGHGSNVADLETTITYDHDARELIVDTPTDSAFKEWIGNAARDGRMAAVFGQLVVDGEGRGVHCVLVPIRSEQGDPVPGVRIEDCGPKLGLDGVDNGRLWFDHVRVPVGNLLDQHAQITDDGAYTSPIENPTRRFFTMLGTLVQGRVSVGGAAIHATQVAQTIAVQRALHRRQFGAPGEREALLLDYRTHQRRLLPDVATTYALAAAQAELRRELARVFDPATPTDEREQRELETRAAGVKALATWHATRTIQECREACGGAGYSAANRLAALKADTDVFTTFEGDNTVLLQLVAKNLLSDFRDEVGGMDPLGLARFFAGQVLSTVAEKSAVREVLGRLGDDLLPGRDEEADLLEHDTQLELLRWRHEHVKASAARRLKAGMDRGDDPFAVLVGAQDHVLLVARSWVDHELAAAFVRAVRRTTDPEARAVLGRLASLHALRLIETERGWFQEHGKLSSTRSKAVVKAVNDLCGLLRPDAAALVEGFGVPEACLGDAAPVAAGREAPSLRRVA